MSLTSLDVPSPTGVFISYSRNDEVFVERLAEALDVRGYVAIYDTSEKARSADPALVLAAQDEWWTQLKAMIAAADVMVFVVTPESAASRICDDEIAHAKNLGKRVIAILRRHIDFNRAPERLRALNVRIEFKSDDDNQFETAVAKLCSELDIDIEWHRQGGHFVRLAERWDRAGRPDWQLLRSGAVAECESWAIRQPRHAPEIGQLVLTYLNASREKERNDSEERRRIIARTFVLPARQAFASSRFDHAVRLVAAGALLADDPGFALSPELWQIGAQAIARMPLLRALGHGGAVRHALIVGGRVVTAADDGFVRVWTLPDCEGEALTLELGGPITGLAVSRDEQVAFASTESEIKAWRLRDGSLRASYAIKSRAMAVGGDLLLGVDGALLRVDPFTGKQKAHVGLHSLSWPTKISLSATGAQAALVGGTRRVEVLDLVSNKVIRVLALPKSKDDEHDWFTDVAISPSGGRIAASSVGGRVVVWERDGIVKADWQAHQRETYLAWFPGEDAIITGAKDESIKAWDWQAATDKAVFLGHGAPVTCLSVSADGKTLLSGSEDRTARLWRASPGLYISALREVDQQPLEACVSPDGGKALITYREDGPDLVDVADPNSRTFVFDLKFGFGASFTHDSAQLLCPTVDGDSDAALVDCATGESVRKYCHAGEYTFAEQLRLSPDGSVFATCRGDNVVTVRTVASGDETVRLHGHSEKVNDAVFDSAGSRLVTASDDGTARLWAAASGAQIQMQQHESKVTCAASSPDGRHIATGCEDGSVHLWDAGLQRRIHAPTTGCKKILSLSFAPDGARLLCQSDGGVTNLFSVQTGAHLFRLPRFRENTEFPQKDVSELSPVLAHFTSSGIIGFVRAEPGGFIDLSTSALIANHRAAYVAAALKNGVGQRVAGEEADILLSAAPADMNASFQRLLTVEQASETSALSKALRRDLHSNCYPWRQEPTNATPQTAITPADKLPHKYHQDEDEILKSLQAEAASALNAANAQPRGRLGTVITMMVLGVVTLSAMAAAAYFALR